MKKFTAASIRFFCIAAASMAIISCFESTGSSERKTAKIQLVSVTKPSTVSLLKSVVGLSSVNLESFQVAIQSISLTKDMPLGAGLEFYHVSALQSDHTNSIVNAGNATDTANDKYYVDFMTASGREKISQSAEFDESQLGEYNWIHVNWVSAFRIRAAVPLGDGRTVYTKPGPIDSSGRRDDRPRRNCLGSKEQWRSRIPSP
jgi:hypothetical protein